MSVVYEPRQFHHSDNYPSIVADPDEHDGTDPSDVRFGDHDVADLGSYNLNPLASGSFPSPDAHHSLPELAPAPSTPQVPALPTPKDDIELHTPQRSKPIPKPDRSVRKNMHGKYQCTWPDCTEEVKEFGRKCEWNKHMDKHDRPYKCPAEGCEKLPGFTYSGGLLRHEREVHGKHGGPKNPLNCPHVNCKRHTGKGFSRLENLNEHLRRVHTNNAGAAASGDEAHEDSVSVVASEPATLLPVVLGEKRKHDDDDEDDVDLRREIKRLHQENAVLSQNLEAQNRQSMAMMGEIEKMRDIIKDLQSQQQLHVQVQVQASGV
ncbi:C2H2 transcription factor [Xylariales sp. AK1849]|nr:C2H2 transcription factor [Xylariales sp. AK1849]